MSSFRCYAGLVLSCCVFFLWHYLPNDAIRKHERMSGSHIFNKSNAHQLTPNTTVSIVRSHTGRVSGSRVSYFTASAQGKTRFLHMPVSRTQPYQCYAMPLDTKASLPAPFSLLRTTNCYERLSSGPSFFSSGRSVLEVATEMSLKRTDAALLMKRGRVAGIITDHDLTRFVPRCLRFFFVLFFFPSLYLFQLFGQVYE